MKLDMPFLAAAIVSFNRAATDSSSSNHDQVPDKVIIEQRHNLAKNTEGNGFGPQSPRDIDAIA